MTVLLKPVQGGRPIVLDKPILLIGRHPDCDIILKDSPKISRKHCCLALVDSRFVIRDLDSMNGVWVNGDRVEHSADVQISDELVVGDVAFILEKSGTEESPVEPDGDSTALPTASATHDENGPVKQSAVDPGTRVLRESGESIDANELAGDEKIEFSSAFAIPSTDSQDDDDFVIPLADVDD